MNLVIFDCDGTLVDSQNAIFAAMRHAFDAADLPVPSRQAVLGVVGLSLPQAFAALAPAEAPSVQVRLADHYRSGFAAARSAPGLHEPLYPGAGEAIAALAARDDIVLGVATGKSRRGVQRLFDRFQWHPHFVTIQTADDNPSKPHPAMIQRAIVEAGVDPGATVMVGDTAYDMAMAVNAGVGAIGVRWGYHSADEIAGAGAHTIVDDFPALLAAIDRRLADQRERAR